VEFGRAEAAHDDSTEDPTDDEPNEAYVLDEESSPVRGGGQ
jgi:hypothetical protein